MINSDGSTNAIVEGLWNRATDQLYAGVDTTGKGAKGDDPTKNSLTGGEIAVPCNLLSQIKTTANSFQQTTYHVLGPNSNSFLHWLIVNDGLSLAYPTPPPGAYGWFLSIPGNPY